MAKKVNKLMATKLTPSANLAAVIGGKAINRPMAVKAVWAYIKRAGLQDKKNKRMINANEKIQPLFGKKKQVSMFDLAKIISANLK